MEIPDNFSRTDKTCPECGGVIYEDKQEPEEHVAQQVTIVRRFCENYGVDDGNCKFYEEEGRCPECGGELKSQSYGPGRFVGARSGTVSCKSCDFSFSWSE